MAVREADGKSTVGSRLLVDRRADRWQLEKLMKRALLVAGGWQIEEQIDEKKCRWQ